MKYQKHGTTLIATLLVAIMALSVFAMPALAATPGTVHEEAEITFDSDDIVGGTDTESDTFNVTFGDGEVDNEDTIHVQLNNTAIDDIQEDFGVDSATVTDESDAFDSAGAAPADEEAGWGSNGNDVVEITLNTAEGADGVNVENEYLEIDVTIEAANGDNVEEKADLYDDTPILTFADTGNVDPANVDLDGEDAVSATIIPGAPSNADGDITDGQTSIEGDAIGYNDEAFVEVTNIEDGQNNDITDREDAIAVRFDGSDSLSDEDVDNVDIEDGEANVTIANATGDETFNTVLVEDMDVEIRDDQGANDDIDDVDGADNLDIYPDDVDLEFAEDDVDETSVGSSVSVVAVDLGVTSDASIDQVDAEFEVDTGTATLDDPTDADLSLSPTDTASGIQTSHVEADGTIIFDDDGFHDPNTVGERTLSVDVVPGVGTGDSEASDTINATGDIEEINTVDVETEFIGVVSDESHLIANVSDFVDEEGTSVTNTDKQLTIGVDGSSGEISATVDIDQIDGDGVAQVDENPESLDDTTDTEEEATLTIDANNGDGDATETVRTVHEVAALDEGWNTLSVPLPAETYLDVEGTADITQFDPTDEEYSGIAFDEGEMVTSATDLHRGKYVYAQDGDDRFAFDFNEESGEIQPGDVELQNGWQFVSSNYDITSLTGQDANYDLFGVENVQTAVTGSAGVWAWDDSQDDHFDGESSNIDEYDAYWVYEDGGTDTQRGIVATPYDPT